MKRGTVLTVRSPNLRIRADYANGGLTTFTYDVRAVWPWPGEEKWKGVLLNGGERP